MLPGTQMEIFIGKNEDFYSRNEDFYSQNEGVYCDHKIWIFIATQTQLYLFLAIFLQHPRNEHFCLGKSLLLTCTISL